MNPSGETVIGIDVGGSRKGFHAVALRNGHFEPRRFDKATEAAAWCREREAQAIAIDAPCGWASVGGSRLAERSLEAGGETVQCFKTPTRASAEGRAFYEWVFNGEDLYQCLSGNYSLFDGTSQGPMSVFETFPHAIVCSLAGRVVPARPKTASRRRVLREQGRDDQQLANIDFVDAALCALTADRFLHFRTHHFGNREEGFIVVPCREY